MKRKRRRRRRVLAVLTVVVAVLAAALLIHFPGRQTPIALTLATGIGIPGLQARVDRLEDKAINGHEFTEDDKRFLRDLYTCFAKGGRLTIVLRQSGAMMQRYLSGTGEALFTAPRIFVNSRPVQQQMRQLEEQALADLEQHGSVKSEYASETFYMPDPRFFESAVGLYFGRVFLRPSLTSDNRLTLAWRAEVPWQWPTYESLFEKYGDHHAQCFPLPNAGSIILGPERCLWINNGLGGHLPRLGLAKPFLVYSRWQEDIDLNHAQANAPSRDL